MRLTCAPVGAVARNNRHAGAPAATPAPQLRGAGRVARTSRRTLPSRAPADVRRNANREKRSAKSGNVNRKKYAMDAENARVVDRWSWTRVNIVYVYVCDLLLLSLIRRLAEPGVGGAAGRPMGRRETCQNGRLIWRPSNAACSFIRDILSRRFWQPLVRLKSTTTLLSTSF